MTSLTFDNRFTSELPADPETANMRRQVMGACYSRVLPKRAAMPQLVSRSHPVMALLDLPDDLIDESSFAEVFSGNRQIDGMDPYATCYGGHQFGNWAGQLGDGRAINLGEIINPDGQRWALQLKGAGPTPYSRTADGLAVLRSSIREYLCSEAMHHLGVPTTRALSVILTGEEVVRDMFYDGHPRAEPGAVVCRVAPSFTRFGNFQIFATRGEIDVLRRLADYTIRTDFPHLGEPSGKVYVDWFSEVCHSTAEMVVHWMRVGFVHGVMNTDNMSILGLTIDYGPYGWLEDYDPDWTPNTTDAQGRRYRYGHQPQIAHWNLYQLANAILPLIGETDPLEQALATYTEKLEADSEVMMAQKLGLKHHIAVRDDELVRELLEILQLVETDMTIFYRCLAETTTTESDSVDYDSMGKLMAAYYVADQVDNIYLERLHAWLANYRARVQFDGTSDEDRRAAMNAVNPKYVLRNYLAQMAIDKSEAGDHTLVNELLELLQRPYDEQPDKQEYAARRPDWARHRAGCSMLSCSS